MTTTGLLAWSCCFILASANVVHVLSSTVIPGVGVNWGTMASNPLPRNTVTNMLKDNGVNKVKLFDSDSPTVKSLAGTGIEVMVGIPNNQLYILAGDIEDAEDWVKENITTYLHDGGVDIRYVAVGNEPFLSSYNNTFDNITFPALQNVQKALDKAGVGDKIKATVALNADVYESHSDKPSDGDFRKDIKDLMIKIVKFLHQNKSPFVVNIYPFLSLYQNAGFPFDFAFFDGGKTISDKNVSYSNVFDANYDTLVWTLKKNGADDLKIIVGEVGWPTDGNINANNKLAKKFYDGLLKKLVAKKGTPLRPGQLDVYLFSLVDENQKSIAPGHFERHWGLFYYDGQPKFPIDLSGKGNDKMLVAAKGVQYMSPQWCVLNEENKNLTMIADDLSYACSLADCTRLDYGSSCNKMDLDGNVSYAFNMYFQMNGQEEDACDFNGLGMIVKTNASRGSCLFPLQIVGAGERLKLAYGVSIIAGLLLAFFT
uniref:glucan endo-1,3-beta-D-glucosidase n=1 Tax=Salix viminalis TaxID=40686 RepID=A0A6N2LK06_SALVM